jgi:hypothetical protein
LALGIAAVSQYFGFLNWFEDNVVITAGLLVAWVALLVGSLWAAHYFLVTIPPKYFTREHQPLDRWRHSHPALRWTLLVAKNLIGGVLAIAGIIMLFTPGQGILTLLLGLSLVDLPGKRALERRIVSRPAVLRLVNQMRAKARKPPLEVS